MDKGKMNFKKIYALLLAAGLLVCEASQARGFDRGPYNGGYNYNHGYDNRYYNDNYRGNYNYYGTETWGSPGVMISVPDNCSSAEECDSDGNCVENQVCE